MFGAPVPEQLRALIRDPRYRLPGQDGDAYRSAVTAAFRAQYGGAAESDGRSQGGLVHVHEYQRRGSDGAIQTVQAHTRGAPQRAWEGQPNATFRQRIAEAERSAHRSDFGYGEVGSLQANGERALGRYQFLRSPLADAGWHDPETGRWTGPALAFGIRSDDDFLASPAAQEAAFTDAMRKFRQRLSNNGSLEFVGTTMRGLRNPSLVITEPGLLAAVHRRGPTAVARYLRHLAQGLPEPGGDRGRAFREIETRIRLFADAAYAW